MTDYTKVKLGKQTAHHDTRVPMLSKYTAGLPGAATGQELRHQNHRLGHDVE